MPDDTSSECRLRHSTQTLSAGGAMVALLGAVCSACGTAQVTESGALSSYAGLRQSDGILTKTRQRADRSVLLNARSIQIEPTRIAKSADTQGLTPQQLALVTNTVNRSLCSGLSNRYVIARPNQSADLVVQAEITHLQATDVTLAGFSSVLSIGSTVVSATTGLPVPSARLPLGLGGLSIEAQAITQANQQVAAITWARGADSLTTRPRMSEESDAYQLAKAFGDDFARLLVTGDDPIANPIGALPPVETVGEYFGGKPRFAACEQFGRHPGLGDALGGAIGLPPAWTDKGAVQGQ